MKKLQKVTYDSDNVTVSGKCVFTKKPYSVKVPRNEYDKWLDGELIQRAMPSVSADDREFLISGVSPEGWKQTFGSEE